MREHKPEEDMQELPSTFIIFCAVISKGLLSQVSSWTEVHKSMLEEVNREGKQRQNPGPHFLLDKLLGFLVL